ncbi:S-layer homology domain-containing protein [Ammoniphilus resinae]|uniref:SLH domain-containing protein n=1 Tax=Ammoniphilus resinae TaxID=861532 RepID=A0ABS4GP36_9BACL|nr:S-layer homology domain-containing protein [Ammoniphilus resinae]MBP1931822.1 hypothetical protein [Ammoniphilus resinae]
MKKQLSLLIASALLISLFNDQAFANSQITDISTHWAKTDVRQSVEWGFIKGYGDGTFKPDNPITRAEFTTALVQALNLKLSTNPSVFVDDNNWAETYIQTAIENKLIHANEYKDLRFDPSRKITRQEIAVMTVRALDKAKDAEDQGFWNSILSKLTDLTNVDEQFRGYVKIANDLGIVKGYADGSFGPNKTATRAEAVVMVIRTLEKLPNPPVRTIKPEQPSVDKDRFGRTIRTTNLPKNYKDYPYIVASIPNEMYEMPYSKRGLPSRMTSAQLYKNVPEFTDENVDVWMERISKYYDLIFNVDYRTIDGNWEKKAYEYIHKGANEDYLKKQLKEYREWVQKNQIVIEGWLKPEPTMVYSSFGGYNVRSEFEFKIVSFKQNKNLLYDPFADGMTLNKGVTYKGYADIEISAHMMGDWGQSLRISNLASVFLNNKSNLPK